MKELNKEKMFAGRDKIAKVTACKCKYGCGCSKYSAGSANNEYKKCYDKNDSLKTA